MRRFEGEQTLVELIQKIQRNEDWRSIAGIAFRGAGGKVTATPLRPSVAELDSLPLPFRADIDYESSGYPTASMLGSRGCPWNCSFCSIRPFYEAQGGRLRRFRQPDAIVREMVDLYRQRKVPIFLFQDDDFLGGGVHARNWAEEIAAGIIRAGLAGKIAFKISCRSDEIHAENMEALKAGGLTHVYMGVESGDEQGLANMNKHLRPAQHIRAAKILKAAGLSFDFGFMLLDPYSTFDSIRNNIAFLEDFVGDGWTVASFCRMLPYAGTPVKTSLEAEDRLLGSPFEPDYRFLDPRIDRFYQWMLETFYERNFTNTGLCQLLKSLQFEAHIHLPAYRQLDAGECLYIQHLTAVCNGIATYTLRAAVDYFEHTPETRIRKADPYLEGLTLNEKNEERKLTREIMAFYAGVQNKKRRAKTIETTPRAGSFENAWTLA
jgi:anaerobic magnesium-protoporphyrin IX monomethyl ester cyclase